MGHQKLRTPDDLPQNKSGFILNVFHSVSDLTPKVATVVLGQESKVKERKESKSRLYNSMYFSKFDVTRVNNVLAELQ